MNVLVFWILTIAICIYFAKDIIDVAKSGNKHLPKKKRQTAKEYVAKLNGIAKTSFLKKNIKNVRDVLGKTQRQSRYNSIMKRAALFAVVGIVIGITLNNIFLSVTLGCGLYFLPLWTTQFSLYAYKTAVNEELEVALSLITTSYLRGNDILKAIEENVENVNYPVKQAFEGFINSLKYISVNINDEIDKLKCEIDSKLFHEWCDILILCQSDHTLKYTLVPIVGKFSDLKAQQAENETNMMLPFRTTIQMVCLVLVMIPLLYMFDSTWFYSGIGKIAIALTAVVIFWCIDAAIKLSKPIEYDV